MSTWNVTAGTGDMRVGTSADGGKTVRWSGGPRSLTHERSAATDVRFQPGTTTTLDFRLVEATRPHNQRLDHRCGRHAVATDQPASTLTLPRRAPAPLAAAPPRTPRPPGRL